MGNAMGRYKQVERAIVGKSTSSRLQGNDWWVYRHVLEGRIVPCRESIPTSNRCESSPEEACGFFSTVFLCGCASVSRAPQPDRTSSRWSAHL